MMVVRMISSIIRWTTTAAWHPILTLGGWVNTRVRGHIRLVVHVTGIAHRALQDTTRLMLMILCKRFKASTTSPRSTRHLLRHIRHIVETPRVGVCMREGRGMAKVSDNQCDVIEAARSLALSARPAKEALDILDNVLRHHRQIRCPLHLLCHKLGYVVVDHEWAIGPGLVRLVKSVRHEDEKPMALTQVDGLTDIRLSSTRLTTSFAREREREGRERKRERERERERERRGDRERRCESYSEYHNYCMMKCYMYTYMYAMHDIQAHWYGYYM